MTDKSNGSPGSKPTFPPEQNTFQLLQDKITGIEATIQTLWLEISSLKSQQNLLTPIGSLPEEFLVEIFSHLVYDGPGTHVGSFAWIKEVTHVCTRWRKIALQTPRFWSRPSFVSPEVTAAMISRANGAPLEFVIDLENDVDGFCGSDTVAYYIRLLLAVENLPEANSLVLEDAMDRNLLYFVRRCEHELDYSEGYLSLESVTISAEYTADEEFPINLFKGNDSNLRCIRLRNWNLFQGTSPADLSWISSINQLEITVADPNEDEPYQKSPVRRVVSYLDALPQLKTLILRNMFVFPSPSGSPAPSGSVTLSSDRGKEAQRPMLDDLVLEDHPLLCHSFLTQFGGAPKRSLAVHCNWDGHPAIAENYDQLISAIRQIVADPNRITEMSGSIVYRALEPPVH